MNSKVWTKEEFKAEVERHYKEMKLYGFSKSDCKRDIENVIKQNGIVVNGMIIKKIKN